MSAALEVRRPTLTRAQLAGRLAQPVAAAAVFLAVYPGVRFTDKLFTVSDLLFCFAAVLLLTAGRVPLRAQGGFTPLWLGCVTMMIAALFLGSIVHGDPERWLVVAGQYLFAYVLVPFIVMSGDVRRTLQLAKVAVASLFIVEAVGILVYYDYGGPLEMYQRVAPDFITGARRLGSFLGDANWNGMIIAMTMPLLLYLGYSRHLSAFTTLVTGAVLVWGLVLASSFTGFSTAICASLLFMVVAGGLRGSLRLLAVAAGGLFLFWAAGGELPSVFQKRVLTAFESGDLSQAGTFTGRMELIREAWEIVEEVQIVGLGVDKFREASVQGEPVHNMYLLLWAEGGVFALLGWVLLLLVMLVASLRCLLTDRQLAALGVSTILTFVINSVAAPHMYARLWVMPLHLSMGLVFAHLVDVAFAPPKPATRRQERFGARARTAPPSLGATRG